MICNLKDLDTCLDWMRRNGYMKCAPESWPMSVTYGGFEIVCSSRADTWIIWAKSDRVAQPHQLLWGDRRVVAPWVVEQIMALSVSARSDRE